MNFRATHLNAQRFLYAIVFMELFEKCFTISYDNGKQNGVSVQDNLRSTFVNGRKLFLPAAAQKQFQFPTQSQRQPASSQSLKLSYNPQKLSQPYSQDSMPQTVNGNVVDYSFKRKNSRRWQKPYGIPRKTFNALKMRTTRPTPRFSSSAPIETSQNTAAKTDGSHYHAADESRKSTNANRLSNNLNNKKDKKNGRSGYIKSSKPSNFTKFVYQKSVEPVSLEDRSSESADMGDKVLILTENSKEAPRSGKIATQSTEDLAEPPSFPSSSPPPESLMLPSTSRPNVTTEQNFEEKKETKKDKKNKEKNKSDGLNGNNRKDDKEMFNSTMASERYNLSQSTFTGDAFTEYVNPDHVTPLPELDLLGSTISEEINGYSPPMISTEHTISNMLRCQDMSTRALLPSATTCRNTRSDKVCAYLFAEVDQKTGRRDVKCNLRGMEDIAESCRRTCGICCEDINYSCEDDSNGIIDCSKQLDKCHIPKWFGVLSRFCAGSCGLCALTKCRDYDETCRVRKGLCLEESTIDYMRDNCARTCGFCFVNDQAEGDNDNIANMIASLTSSNGRHMKTHISSNGNVDSRGSQRFVERPPKMGGGSVAIANNAAPECIDQESSCLGSKELCGNPIYAEYMIKFCTRTCLKCGVPGANGVTGGNGPSSIASAIAAAEMLRRFKSAPAPIHPVMMKPTESPLKTQHSEPYYDKTTLYTKSPEKVDSIDSLPNPHDYGEKRPYDVLDLLKENEEQTKVSTTSSDTKSKHEEPASSINSSSRISISASSYEGAGLDGLFHPQELENSNEFPEWKSKSNLNDEKSTIINKSKRRRCQDRHHKCTLWVSNGFCTSPRFTVGDRLRLCPKACKLCNLI